METAPFNHPGLIIALALAAGMISQALAHHLRLPGIVLLLAAGVALGPDGAGLIHPEALGSGLNILTGFAVAVILFEGGINLKFRRLRRTQHSIRRLILLGGPVTLAGAATAAHWIMDWPWQTALLFGTLVMVTGPTVINPLLKRLKVKRTVATVLEAEGVLIDAFGAVVATVALEAALSPAHGTPLVWGLHVVSRLGFGTLCGCALGMVLIFLYRLKRCIPEGTENVFTLAAILALFQGSNQLLPESGLAAVTTAGIIVGNFSTHALRDLAEFKEELTVLLIGMLFVLLAADVRLSHVMNLGWPALGLVLVLMFLIRPAAVFAGTVFSDLQWKERLLIAWIGPRGIVAAAVASFFANAFGERGLTGGYELRAMVFLVIASTVVVAGLTGGFVAGALGLRRPSQAGWVILGANALARGLARLFREDSQETILIDSNADHCMAAQNDCTRIIYGNGLQSRNLLRAEIDTRRGALALTGNDEVNYLFVQKVKEQTRGIALWTALKMDSETLTRKMLHRSGIHLIFGAPIDVEIWDRRFRSNQVYLQHWRCRSNPPRYAEGCHLMTGYPGSGLIAAAMRREKRLSPVGDGTRFKAGDKVYFFVFKPEIDTAREFLKAAGWRRLDLEDQDAFTTSTCHLKQGKPTPSCAQTEP